MCAGSTTIPLGGGLRVTETPEFDHVEADEQPRRPTSSRIYVEEPDGKGWNFSPPACCEKTPCAAVGRRCCNCCGILDVHRTAVMRALFGIQLLAIIPASIALVGSARGRQLTTGGWAVVDVNGKNGMRNFDVFVGFDGIYRKSSSGDEFLRWDDVKDTVPSGKKDDANECKHAARDEYSTAILGLITILPSLTTIWTRTRAIYDTGCNKFIGVMSGTLGGLSTLSSLSTFTHRCYRTLPTDFVVGDLVIGEGHKSHGPGLVCEGIVVAVSFLTAIVHLLMPIPPLPQFDDDDDAAAAAAASAASDLEKPVTKNPTAQSRPLKVFDQEESPTRFIDDDDDDDNL